MSDQLMRRPMESMEPASRRYPPLPVRAPGEFVVGSLEWVASAAYGGKDQMMELAWSLAASQGGECRPEFREFIDAWLHYEQQHAEGTLEARATLNQIAMALKGKFGAAEFVEWLARGVSHMCNLVARQKLALETDGIIEMAVQVAKTPDGFRDRKMLLESQGIVTTAPAISIQNNQVAVGKVSMGAREREEMKSPLMKFRGTMQGVDDAVRGQVIDGEVIDE